MFHKVQTLQYQRKRMVSLPLFLQFTVVKVMKHEHFAHFAIELSDLGGFDLGVSKVNFNLAQC